MGRRLLGLDPPELHRPTAVRRRALGTVGSVARERIEVDTSDGDTVRCLLLSPEAPARGTVIAVHQHAGEFSFGKSEVERQRGWSTAGAHDEQLDALLRTAHGSSLQAKHTKDIATPELGAHFGCFVSAGPDAFEGEKFHQRFRAALLYLSACRRSVDAFATTSTKCPPSQLAHRVSPTPQSRSPWWQTYPPRNAALSKSHSFNAERGRRTLGYAKLLFRCGNTH